MNTSSGDNVISVIPEQNPLLISAVITRILEVLPLREIKNVRFICREWNSLAEPLLRKKAKIVFTPKFGPSDYLEYYSESRLSTLPFTAFKFTNYFVTSQGFSVSDLDDFFNKCGKNIKSLELDDINISTAENHTKPEMLKSLDISRWITLLSDNMDKLNISSNSFHSTNLQFNLENLSRVKSLWLSNCGVIVNSSNINRIAPSEISLTHVQFLNQSQKKLTDVIVNDFVDFSKCSNIYLDTNAVTFDMSKDIVDAKKLKFSMIKVLNSGFSKIKTDFLSVSGTQSEAIKMHMKELDILFCSSLNLTHLPQTIEKLKIVSSGLVPDITLPLDLPNLNYLHFDHSAAADGIRLESALCLKKFLSWFKHCSNLVQLHLDEYRFECELDVAWLPKTVKRLKLTHLNNIVFVGDSPPVDVDVLILDSVVSSEVELLMEKVKPKMLVKLVAFNLCSAPAGKEKVEDFISFVKKNTQLEKIVISTFGGLGKESSPGKTCFLQFAGEESPCYEFNNQIAKAISKEEFYREYYDINYINADLLNALRA